jgi:hypothetical protein
MLVTKGLETGRIVVQGQSGQKVLQIPFQPMAEHSDMCLSSQLYREAQIGGLLFR